MKIAAITMVYNESIYLPIWINYYGKVFGFENLFVVDHGSSDGSMEAVPRGVNVLRIPRHEAFDEIPRTRFVNSLQQTLFEYFDAVIYSDADEIIVIDPNLHSNFQSFLQSAPSVTAPAGLNVFHATDRESAIDLRRPILGQRKYCQFSTFMCKPVICKTPVVWSLGFHTGSAPPHYSNDAFLFHLKSIDFNQSLERLARNRAMEWSAFNVQHGISGHQRIPDNIHIEAFFNNPLQKLLLNGASDFNFSEDIGRLNSSVRMGESNFEVDHFDGKVAEIHEKFFGIF